MISSDYIHINLDRGCAKQ